jgi:mono/diheme cytochrome c family protein
MRVARITFALAAIALSSAAFASAAFAQGASHKPLTPRERMGQELFTQSCQVCHIPTQLGARGSYGPPLSRATFGGDDQVTAMFIKTGTDRMPGFGLHFSDDQLGAIAAFVKTMEPRPVVTAPAAPRGSRQDED